MGCAAPGPAGIRRSPRPEAGSGGPGRRATLGVTATPRARSGTPEDLLGGETEMVPINRRLTLVTRRDGEAERLTIRYALHRLGHEPAPIAGECAVVAVGAEGCLLDMGRHDLAAAARYIRPV